MSLPRLSMDFARRRNSTSTVPWAVLTVAVIAVTGLVVAYGNLAREGQGIELRLEQYAPSPTASERALVADNALLADARAIALELSTPWSRVLEDLESAGSDSGGSVAVLSIAPDRGRGKLTLIAEARSLTAALSYIQRLQKSRAIAHPLLDSHEVRADVAERPVRVQISADWRVAT